MLYLIALGFGVAVHYSIMLALAAVSFWIVRAQGLVYGYFNFLQIARYPDVIFPAAVPFHLRLDHSGDHRRQHSGATPDQAALRSLLADVPPQCAGRLALVISRTFWNFALRRYSSASS